MYSWLARSPDLFEAAEQVVALVVDVRRRDVGDLAGGAAQADVRVVHRRADPDRSAIFARLLRASRIARDADAADCCPTGCSNAASSLRPNRYKLLTGASTSGRESTVSMPILRSLLMPSAAAGNQPAAFMIASSCSCVPTSATFSGSPG